MQEQEKSENVNRGIEPTESAPAETDDASSARGWILGIATVLVAAAVFLLITQAPKRQLPAWNRPILGYPILTLFWVAVAGVTALALLRTSFHATRRKFMRGLKRLVICVSVAAVLIVAFDIVFAAYPSLQSSFVQPEVFGVSGYLGSIEDSKYGFKGKPDATFTFNFDPVHGGNLLDLPPSKVEDTGEKAIVYTIHHDKNGFSNPEVPKQADFIIVGDSLTDEWLSPDSKPWSAIVRENVGGGVYNIAVPGWGPACESMALKEFGVPLKPKVVIWSYCEYNDMSDAAKFQAFKLAADGRTWKEFFEPQIAPPPRRFPYNRPFVRLLLHGAELLNPRVKETTAGREDGGVIHLTAGGKTTPHALDLTDFTRMLKPRRDYAPWDEWVLVEGWITNTIKLCKENDIQFVLVYFPSKTRVYLPLIKEQKNHDEFYEWAKPQIPKVWQNGPDAFFAQLDENKSNVEDLLRKLCEDNGAVFISLTDAFTTAARAGDYPWWSYDLHLNPHGHALAGKIVLEQLRRRGLIPQS
jgi:hypothetical protein